MKSLHWHCKSKPTEALNPFTRDQCVSHYKICHVISLKLISANITTWVCRAMLRKLIAFASRFSSHMILFHHWRWTPHMCVCTCYTYLWCMQYMHILYWAVRSLFYDECTRMHLLPYSEATYRWRWRDRWSSDFSVVLRPAPHKLWSPRHDLYYSPEQHKL